MSGTNIQILEEFKSLNKRIDRVYEEKTQLMNDTLADIKEKFGYLIDDDDSASEDIRELLEPKTVTRIQQTPAKDIQLNKTRVLSKKSTKSDEAMKLDNSTSSDKAKSPVENTICSDTDDESTFVSIEVQNGVRKMTPLKKNFCYFKYDHVNRFQPVQKNEQVEFDIMFPKPNNSMFKSSIDTVDMECPLGSSTPEDSKSKKYLTKPKIEIPKKNHFTVNPTVDPKKRKREILKQKVPAVESKLKENQARVKRQVVLKYEKKKQEENTKIAKQKEQKFKIPPKMFAGKNTLKKGKSENTKKEKDTVEEYNIDHVIEGASSDEEDEPKNQIPKWATVEGREYPANVQGWLNRQETVYKWFFNEKLKTPVLEELFSSGVRTRSRTSSAVWHRPI